jgi:hypothetical protein
MLLPDKKVMCYHTGFKMPCFKGVTEHSCPKWMQVLGKNPQTGEDANRYGCADSFVPLLLIENSKMQRETGAAIDQFRDKMVQLNEPATRMLDGSRSV